MTQEYIVLSIDAWGNNEEGYDWNAWYRVGHYNGDIDNDEEIF